MKVKLAEHLLSICLVAAVLGTGIYFFQQRKQETRVQANAEIVEFLPLTFMDLNQPFHRALFTDLLDLYRPGAPEKNKHTVEALLRYRENEFRENLGRAATQEGLTRNKILQLAGMYAKFVLVYLLVMAITYYGVQTLGVWRFIKSRQISSERPPRGRLAQAGMLAAQGLATLVMFSPAYVISYALKTEINTDTIFFLVLLATLSNGLLVTYAHKFYTFLVAESRKGYVDTATVKNLHAGYGPDVPGGISRRAVFALRKRFDGHVLEHIFRNARSQYLLTLKEQASFLITGLVIIEMALNIHGYLNYEMLRQILYKNYDIVMAIMLSIFITVKLTEIAADVLAHREAKKYAN